MQADMALTKLLAYARDKGLLEAADVRFAQNALLNALGLDTPPENITGEAEALPETATPMLETLCDLAVSRALVEDTPWDRENFAAHLMNLLTPLPSRIIASFEDKRSRHGIQAATDWFYALCRANDYIRVDQIAKNIVYDSPSPYGNLEITINLSKPEKDPREIARLKDTPATGYPACMLCLENEGYYGRPGYPTHATLRILPITLGGEAWGMQYSPYAYYDEHCIALNEVHTPMRVDRRTFALLLDFVRQFPHYFIGSNADLPIVGGSILNHDHFQGGRHLFPMDKAPAYAVFTHKDYPQVRIEAVRWPMTCLRLTAEDDAPLIGLADRILGVWRTYDDPDNGVFHKTGNEPHNTITPIARRTDDGSYILHLVLRNNLTCDEHPLGVFHPHSDLHHIKRENIGLIEVMGLFILPGRLLNELARLEEYLTGCKALTPPPDEDDPLAKHYAWIAELAEATGISHTAEQAQGILRKALSLKCARVLEDCGVFKQTDEGRAALCRFLSATGIRQA